MRTTVIGATESYLAAPREAGCSVSAAPLLKERKMKLRRLELTVLVAMLAVAFTTLTVRADDNHKDDKKQSAAQAAKVPDGATNILATLEKHLAELKVSVAAKKAGDIHKHANALKKLAGTLPQHATPATKKDVDATVRDLVKAGDAAHGSAHDDNWTEAGNHVTHAEGALKKLKEQFKERKL